MASDAKKQPPRESVRVLDHHELLVIGLVLAIHQPDMYLGKSIEVFNFYTEVCRTFQYSDTSKSSNQSLTSGVRSLTRCYVNTAA